MGHSLLRPVVWLAMAQLCCAGLMSSSAHAGGWPSAWANLWRTPDQQARALLAAGQPAQAATRFHDPRWQAYADLAAARYQQAARRLAAFTDANSEYNRGNALAESGQLQAALAAYDAALKLAPADADSRHNRDLVARALRQQQQSRRNGSGSPQSGSRSPQSGGSGQMASHGSRAGAGQSGSSGRQPNAPQASGERRGGNSKDAAGEARRDATFAESATKGAGQGPDQDRLVAGGTQTPQQKPETERQLMIDEWLRQIPDSPAGLLQRQFLIDHMMRQQNSPGAAP